MYTECASPASRRAQSGNIDYFSRSLERGTEMTDEKFNRTDLENLIRQVREAKMADQAKAEEEQEKGDG